MVGCCKVEMWDGIMHVYMSVLCKDGESGVVRVALVRSDMTLLIRQSHG